MKKFILFISLFFIGIIIAYSQEEQLLDEFETLLLKIRTKQLTGEKATTQINAYFKKAKQLGKNEFIGRAYFMSAVSKSDIDERLRYIDSSIYYVKDLKDDPAFLIRAYMFKGFTYYRTNAYEEALDNFLLAESVAKATQKNSAQYDIKYNIAALKRSLGRYKEAEELFIECKEFNESKTDESKKTLLEILFQLSSIYYETAQTQKCSVINKEGIQLAKTLGKKDMYYSFVVNEGINLNVKGQYKASIDSLNKGYEHMLEADQQVADFYLGKSYYLSGDKKKGLAYFKKVDTTFNQTNDLYPPLIGAYEYLINDSRQKNDKESQLYYTNQLLKIDSILDKNYKYLLNTIVQKYDVPRYMAERDDVIAELKEENDQIRLEKKWISFAGILISILALGGLLYYYRLKRLYQQRYDTIMKTEHASIEEEISVKDTNLKPRLAIDIDNAIVEEVLKNLQIFEEAETYLTKQITLKDVAKIVKTNSKYLSKIINVHKNKNFANYINDLRIDYLINHVRKDRKYQKYTIRAIAEEIGFTNSESFSRAFLKKTGLKPSYFIKKVRENAETNT